MDLAHAQRFLVVRLGAIGDCLRTLPAVRRLRRERPDAEIGWCVEHWVLPVLEGHPDVDRFHVLDRRVLNAGALSALGEFRRMGRELRSSGYEVALDFHGRFKSGWITHSSGAAARIGYARGDSTEGNHLFTNVHVRLADKWENRVQRFLDLLAPLGIPTDFDPADAGIFVPEELRADARRRYDAAGRPALAVFAGTSARRARDRWPVEKWRELLERLGERGLGSMVCWGPQEEELSRELVAAVGPPCVLAPRTTLKEMVALIACFEAYVGSDTGAMHMAWMQGVPTVTFASPKPGRTFTPYGGVPYRLLQAASYLQEGVRESRQPREIVTAVTVDEAFEAVTELLAECRARTARP